MPSDLERRQRLFQLYAANLALYTSEFPGRCGCPICERVFSKQAVEPATLAMDLAHVYPEACGGKLATLTCKECNSRIGSRYEAELARDYRLVDALGGYGRGRIDGRLHFDGGSIGVTVARRDNHFHFDEVAKQTNPAERERFTSRCSGSDIEFTLQIRAPDNGRHSMAMLHSAYLCLYRYFGFEYVALGNSRWIREILMQAEPPDVVPYLTHFVEPAVIPGATEDVMFMPLVAGVDDTLTCLAVALPAPDPHLEARVVLLPGFGNVAGEAYSTYRHTFKDGARTKISLTTKLYAPEKRLADPRFAAYGRAWWREQCDYLSSE
jgi:hypothetical protein